MNRQMRRNHIGKKPKLEKGALKYVMKRTWDYLKAYPLNLVIVIVSILLGVGFNLLVPFAIQYFIDNHIDVDIFNFSAILLILGGLAVGVIVVVVFGYFQTFLMAKASSKSTTSIRRDAFNKLTNLPIKYFDSNIHGDIMSKLTNDIDAITNALSQVIPQFITTIFTLIGAIIMMFFTRWQLAIVAMLIMPLAIVLITLIVKKGNKYYAIQQSQIGKMNGIVEEDIQGLNVVKLYNQEQAMIDKFNHINSGLRSSSFQGQIYTGMMFPAVRIVDNIIYGVLVTVGAIMYINMPGIISIGQIQSMTQYARMSTSPISNLAQVFGTLQMAAAGGYRVFKLMDEQDEHVGTTDKVLENPQGQIEFKDVWFQYKEDEQVLKGISFKALPGQTVAIVGPTGSGKTTIINLLSRYYDVNKGKIVFDDTDINDLSKKYLRSQIGIVLQTTYLFKGTIMDNIRYGRPNATDEEVIEAAKLAQVHDIIERLPKKYHTKVREGGENFSHGERQLLSIARTILYNPLILVLDEATSSVDTRTESKIQKSMEILTKHRTSFVIAHRLQTIKNADLILVIRNGEIIEQGSHDFLLNKKGLYSEMYKTQFDI